MSVMANANFPLICDGSEFGKVASALKWIDWKTNMIEKTMIKHPVC
jgi:hypothetical protein